MTVDCKQLEGGMVPDSIWTKQRRTWWIAGLKQKDHIGDVWQGWAWWKILAVACLGKIGEKDRQD